MERNQHRYSVSNIDAAITFKIKKKILIKAL